MIRIEFDLGEIKQALESLDRVTGKAFESAVDSTLDAVARGASNQLRGNIRQGFASPTLRDGTVRRRQFGKAQGDKWDPVPRYASNLALFRSGALADAISYVKEHKYRFTVGVQNKMSTYAGGKTIPLPDLASMHETGFPIVVRKTLRMIAYLQIMYNRSWAPESQRHIDRDIEFGTLVINVPARPIWGDTWKNVVPDAKNKMNRTIDGIWREK